MSVEVDNTTDVTVDLDRVLSFCNFALDKLFIHPQATLFVGFIDEAEIEALHIEWMDEPGPTDVLSFPIDELRPGTADHQSPAGTLGDIVICPTVAFKQAADAGHSFMHEVMWLTVHGILHLLGYDHAEPDEEKEMFGLQREILNAYLTEHPETEGAAQ